MESAGEGQLAGHEADEAEGATAIGAEHVGFGGVRRGR
jgi:hypothetical protein